MAKISKTFSLESDTISKIIKFKSDKEFSSDSAALERIIIEWAISNKEVELANLDINEIAEKVKELLKNISIDTTDKVDLTEQDLAITDILNGMED